MARATQRDVAREAGVTQATVSYVINGKDDESISPETIAKVHQPINKLGYVPNQAAKTLNSPRSRGNWRSNMLGVLIPQTEPGKEFMFSNPFYGEFLSAVEYTARINGYHVLISGTDVNQSYLEIAKSRSLDGIIILGVLPSTDLKAYKNSQIPTVMVDCYDNDNFFHSIGINDRYGSYLATKYLIDHGHKQIAFITGSIEEAGVNQKRLLGYKDALEEKDIKFDEAFVFHGEVSYEYGVTAAEAIAKSGLSITAAFATADILALGMLEGFQQAKVSVPEDISVMGFDDIYLTRSCSPPLTTVHQNIKDKGKAAAEIIIEAANNPDMLKRDITIPISITERKSVRKI